VDDAPLSEPPNHARTRSASGNARASKPRSSSTEDNSGGFEQPRWCERLWDVDRIRTKRMLPSGMTDLQFLHT